MRPVVVVSAKRTPIGSFGGALSSFSAAELGAMAIYEVLKEAGVPGENVDEVIFGHVLTAGGGQAPVRQALIKAGLPHHVPATAVNKVCASGMRSVMVAMDQIALGHADMIVAGGMESMSQVPYYLPSQRFGSKLGHTQAEDGILKDGLWDVYNDYHMGSAAELCARECSISREEQDAFAIESYKRAQNAQESGAFDAERFEVKVVGRKGDTTMVRDDEELSKAQFDRIPTLKPVFETDGSVTAANASSLNDGAAALLLMSEDKAKELGLTPLARLHSHASAAQAPEWFTTTPSLAIPKALERAKFQLSDIDLFEINEAFSVVSLANNQKLGLNPAQVDVHGGAVSLGHPIGCSGARILVTLIHALGWHDKTMGCAGICNGGGGASAMVVERL